MRKPTERKAHLRYGSGELLPLRGSWTGGDTLAPLVLTPYVAVCRLRTPFDHGNSRYQGDFASVFTIK